MRKFIVTLVAIITLVATPGALAQDAMPAATPDNPPGFVAWESREFSRSGSGGDGTRSYLFFVAGFDTADHAVQGGDEIIDFAIDRIAASIRMDPTSTALYGDETLAFTGTVESNGETIDAALLFIRDGAVWHVGMACGPRATPLADLHAVADAMQRNRAGTLATPEPGNLAALLPTLADMPPGFVVDTF